MLNAAALGRRLASLRQEAGLSQVELANRMGTSQAAISKIESGVNLPTLPLLERFAEATGRSLELRIGSPAKTPTRTQLRQRVRAVLGDEPFDPWERDPTPSEVKSLEADGLTRERFRSQKSAAPRRRRARSA